MSSELDETAADQFIEDVELDRNTDGKASNIHKTRMSRVSKRFSTFADKHGLTIFTGILALISTCVGGGIVGIPRAFYFLGIPLAVILNFLCVISMIYSVRLYLATKDAVPDKPESLYEIGYMIIGRPAIFILGFIYFIASLGLCMIYFITYGDTLGQLVAAIVGG